MRDRLVSMKLDPSAMKREAFDASTKSNARAGSIVKAAGPEQE